MGASVGDVRAGKVGCLASAFTISILCVCCIIAIFCQLPLWVAPNILKVFFLIGPVKVFVNFLRVDPVEHTYTYEYIYIIFCVWGFILNWGIQSRRFLSLSKNDENVYKEWSLTISTLWKQCPSEKGTFHKLLDRKFFKNMHTTCTQYAHNVHGIFIQYVRNVNA